MGQCVILRTSVISKELEQMVRNLQSGLMKDAQVICVEDYTSDKYDLQNKKIIFALDVNKIGSNIPFDSFLLKASDGHDVFNGSTAVMLIKSANDLFTKSLARHVINVTNKMGLSFLGHGVIEAIDGFKNYQTWQKTIDDSLDNICFGLCCKLGARLDSYEPVTMENPKVLVLHASSNKISNTLMLWNRVKMFVEQKDVKELHVGNGQVTDCKGCSFKTCVHFSEHHSCFYGGEIVDEILPAIEEADIIVWVCPNYNDSISAKLMAVINRMTVLYRRIEFYDKRIYSVIVSGNSGSDSVEEQLIGSLVINKGFFLPGNFSLLEIANDPGSILNIKNLIGDAKAFAQSIK